MMTGTSPHWADKQDIRAKLKQRLHEMSPELRAQCSKAICQHLRKLLRTLFGDTVPYIGFYYPLPYEADLSELFVEYPLKALPNTDNHQPEFYEWDGRKESLRKHKGIFTPTDKKLMRPEVLLIPMLGYKRSGYRLGQGAGFYDRYISANSKVLRIGITFSVQLDEKWLAESYDEKMHYIVNENCNYQAPY